MFHIVCTFARQYYMPSVRAYWDVRRRVYGQRGHRKCNSNFSSFLDVAQVSSDTATGNRVITFHSKGETKARSLKLLIKRWNYSFDCYFLLMLIAVWEMILGRVSGTLTIFSLSEEIELDGRVVIYARLIKL